MDEKGSVGWKDTKKIIMRSFTRCSPSHEKRLKKKTKGGERGSVLIGGSRGGCA